MRDFYYILGVSRTASEAEIKSAYRKLSLKFHPDKNNGEKFFEERFKEIQEAYQTLSSIEERALYDAHLRAFEEQRGSMSMRGDGYPAQERSNDGVINSKGRDDGARRNGEMKETAQSRASQPLSSSSGSSGHYLKGVILFVVALVALCAVFVSSFGESRESAAVAGEGAPEAEKAAHLQYEEDERERKRKVEANRQRWNDIEGLLDKVCHPLHC